jgi:hypothetical protein
VSAALSLLRKPATVISTTLWDGFHALPWPFMRRVLSDQGIAEITVRPTLCRSQPLWGGRRLVPSAQRFCRALQAPWSAPSRHS